MSDRRLTADKPAERLYNGLVKENPTFVLMLGMCPTLAVTVSAINGLGMGLTTTAVLMLSNLMISLLRKVIPGRVRIPAFIVIIASFVTIVQLLLEAYLPALNKSLGVYIPLIVVNCIILGRAESYAYSHSAIASLFDGLGMGLGFSVALTCIGAVRELLGAGKLFGMAVLPESFTPISIFALAPGAFFVLAGLTALQNVWKSKRSVHASASGSESISSEEMPTKQADSESAQEALPAGCVQNCAACGVSGCSGHGRFYDDRYQDLSSDNKSDNKSDEDGLTMIELEEEES
ncbi:MAG: electron transport complex subunit E [Acetatifactor sp.]|nr:electron transport complex subunit E [Acetatifactor sp.]